MSYYLYDDYLIMSLDKMLHDDYLCFVESGKQQRSHKKIQAENLETKATAKRVWISALPSLSRDRRIKMKKSNQM